MKTRLALPGASILRPAWIILLSLVLVIDAAGDAPSAPAAGGGSEGPQPASEPASGRTTDARPDQDPSVQPEPRQDRTEPPAGPRYELEEIVVTATRTPRQILEIPRSMSLVDRKRLDEIQPLVPLDALRHEPGVFIEKRTTSTSDPLLRGFAGRNILTLVDGNSLTTLWGEGGDGADDMYGKIDPDWVERIELIRGPASVLYGSNAIGGVINFITRKPALDFTDDGMDFRFRTKGTYGSAANEGRLRTEIHGATPDFRFMLGGSLRDIDNVEGGRGQGTLDPSDSEAANWDLSAEYRPFGEEHLFSMTYQDTHLAHAKRYYKPDEDNFNDRDALTLSYVNTAANSIWDRLETRLYYQNKKERRRWLSGLEAGQRGVAETQTLSGDVQVTRALGEQHRLSYGLHWERDDAEDPDDEQFTITQADGTKFKQAPDSIWQDYGVFLQDEWEALDRLTVIASARYDAFFFRTNVDSLYVPPIEGQDPQLDQISEQKGIPSGGLGLVYAAGEQTDLFFNWARGFRLNAPNFGLRLLHGSTMLVPNSFLDPITADSFELGAKGSGDGYQATVSAFYMAIDNFQSKVRTTFQGEDSFDADGDGIGDYPYEKVVAGGKGYVKGFETSAEARIDTVAEWLGWSDLVGPEWSVRSTFSWEIGNDRQADEPIRWIHPAFGTTSVRYDSKALEHPFWVELAGMFVHKFDRVAADRNGDREWLADPQDPSSGPYRDYIGVPGYATFDLRGGVALGESSSLTLAVENLTDRRYRSAHSRMPSPGINFIASLDVWF